MTLSYTRKCNTFIEWNAIKPEGISHKTFITRMYSLLHYCTPTMLGCRKNRVRVKIATMSFAAQYI